MINVTQHIQGRPHAWYSLLGFFFKKKKSISLNFYLFLTISQIRCSTLTGWHRTLKGRRNHYVAFFFSNFWSLLTVGCTYLHRTRSSSCIENDEKTPLPRRRERISWVVYMRALTAGPCIHYERRNEA